MEDHKIFKNSVFPGASHDGSYFRLHVDPAEHPADSAKRDKDDSERKDENTGKTDHEVSSAQYSGQLQLAEKRNSQSLLFDKLSQTPSKEESIDNPVENTTPINKAMEIVKDTGRQIIASIIILVIGFFLLNWSAYYQIAMNQWNKYFGVQTESKLTDLTDNRIEENYILPTDLNAAGNEIPELNFEVSPNDNRIIIPRIDKNIPIVRVSSKALENRDWDLLEEEIQQGLKGGVVHYPGTSLPGHGSNTVITGHSSYFPWDPGRFKDVFALLHEVVEGDRIVIYYEQEKFIYEVDEIEIVLPDQIDILKPTPDERLTLITCTPVGTNLKRLIIRAKLIES